ncbi:hypothetical protein BCR43DRAFT_378430 [Syncephalastrum racemosum]|uniref:Uncharacterized protein n=1 Tax=Syncephalastrum racemosum TaxID=13706 RepID=A0A1X2H4Z6_SYNRA|nr:hypothetical protein BCR43DRAFT_378430 [Syncephalastrum racemosum]
MQGLLVIFAGHGFKTSGALLLCYHSDVLFNSIYVASFPFDPLGLFNCVIFQHILGESRVCQRPGSCVSDMLAAECLRWASLSWAHLHRVLSCRDDAVRAGSHAVWQRTKRALNSGRTPVASFLEWRWGDESAGLTSVSVVLSMES